MNKYLRQLLIGSRVPVFLRLGYKDLRKKFRSRHENFQAEIKSWLFPDSQPRVLNGPFKDMPYLDEVIWGSITPRWFGSYERELWDTVDEITSTPYETIIDIGCGTGWVCDRLTEFADVTGTDLADDVLSRSQQKYPNVKFIAGDFSSLDLHGSILKSRYVWRRFRMYRIRICF